MAHAWKACWVQALGGSNPPSSATDLRRWPEAHHAPRAIAVSRLSSRLSWARRPPGRPHCFVGAAPGRAEPDPGRRGPAPSPPFTESSAADRGVVPGRHGEGTTARTVVRPGLSCRCPHLGGRTARRAPGHDSPAAGPHDCWTRAGGPPCTSESELAKTPERGHVRARKGSVMPEHPLFGKSDVWSRPWITRFS